MTGLEFVKAHADTLMEFSSYYKFAFLYQVAGGGDIFVQVGGEREDIYRAELSRVMPLWALLDHAGLWNAMVSSGDRWLNLDTDEVGEFVASRAKRGES